MFRESRFAVSATGAALGSLIFLLAGCSTTPSPELGRYEFTRREMELPFRIVLYAPSNDLASNAAQAAFARIHHLNDVLSDYDSDTELSRLSQTSGQNQEVSVSDDLWRVLARAEEISRKSDGAFDITVGPLVNLWRKARREKKFPDAELLREARSRVGYTNLLLNPRTKTAKLLVPGMRLDVGGIGKGYALDEALKVLGKHGIRRALVTGGGDMAAGDPPPGKPGWEIELPPLDVTNAPPARFVLLKHAGLATSGDLFQRLEIDGKRYSHIVDPRTGIGLTDHSLVTIIAKDATTADGLSKVVSVLGVDRGFPILQSERAEARVVRKPEDKIEERETPGFGKFYRKEPISTVQLQ
jgi:thiamine biosynthesis lipoprotein